jgi:hypothetical protein
MQGNRWGLPGSCSGKTPGQRLSSTAPKCRIDTLTAEEVTESIRIQNARSAVTP